MNFPETMGFVAGGLQFIVAGCALRLNWLFGSARVGWSLFWAFLLLALLRFVQSTNAGLAGATSRAGVKVLAERDVKFSVDVTRSEKQCALEVKP